MLSMKLSSTVVQSTALASSTFALRIVAELWTLLSNLTLPEPGSAFPVIVLNVYWIARGPG